jgi:hypothetical protein
VSHCSFFLKNKITLDAFDSANLDLFSQLDDFDIIKMRRQRNDDFILATLSGMIINRFA